MSNIPLSYWKNKIKPPLIIDKYGPQLFFALFKASLFYNGSAIKVRRSSDNTELDIGFNSFYELDTEALLDFVGSGNGFVSLWYDQSGSTNAAQTNFNAQPIIVENGVIVTDVNGNPVIRFKNNDAFNSGNKFLYFTDGNTIRNKNYVEGICYYNNTVNNSRVDVFGWHRNTVGGTRWSMFENLPTLDRYRLGGRTLDSGGLYTVESTSSTIQGWKLISMISDFINGVGEIFENNVSVGTNTIFTGTISDTESFINTDVFDSSGIGMHYRSNTVPYIGTICLWNENNSNNANEDLIKYFQL